jgi:putative ATP-binding cassette transporter
MPMTLGRFLLGASRGTASLIALAGVVGGACGAGLVALINATLHGGPRPRLLLAFALLVLGKVASTALSHLLLVRFAQDTILALCRTLCRQVLSTPLRRLEELGPPRILAALSDDVASLGTAVQTVPHLVANAAVLAGCAAYLAWLSWTTFLGLLAMLLLGALSYRVLLGRAHRAIRQAREGRDRLFGHFRSLTEGIKELQLHHARRHAFLERNVDRTTEELRGQNLAAVTHFTLADTWTQTLFYGALGLLLFAAPALQRLPLESLTGYVFAALYLMGPIWAIIGALPALKRGQVALAQVQALGFSLSRPGDGPAGAAVSDASRGWTRLDLEGVVFRYQNTASAERGFLLGPVDLTLRPGELVFLVGGNGSGKSTLVKLLCGLYPPAEGGIRVDGRPVTEATREAYRQHFSVVFSDFHLFEDLLGLARPDLDACVREYLVRLGLDHRVQVAGGRLSTTALSQGQRKRLALLVAYLEDRPICVFDEWAADQDPGYKEIFYRKLLPELRARGKAVLVITHDDRYFHLGDRVIRLEEGRLTPAPQAAVLA